MWLKINLGQTRKLLEQCTAGDTDTRKKMCQVLFQENHSSRSRTHRADIVRDSVDMLCLWCKMTALVNKIECCTAFVDDDICSSNTLLQC